MLAFKIGGWFRFSIFRFPFIRAFFPRFSSLFFSVSFQLDAQAEFVALLAPRTFQTFPTATALELGGVGALAAPQKCIFCSRISGKICIKLSRVSNTQILPIDCARYRADYR